VLGLGLVSAPAPAHPLLALCFCLCLCLPLPLEAPFAPPSSELNCALLPPGLALRLLPSRQLLVVPAIGFDPSSFVLSLEDLGLIRSQPAVDVRQMAQLQRQQQT